MQLQKNIELILKSIYDVSSIFNNEKYIVEKKWEGFEFSNLSDLGSEYLFIGAWKNGEKIEVGFTLGIKEIKSDIESIRKNFQEFKTTNELCRIKS